jgi:hypothetical protein
LDYLASELVAGGWRIKPLHRAIVLSSAYRQSSRSTVGERAHWEGAHWERAHWERAKAVDPNNRLLWHFQRRRLDAEALRDAMLDAAGRLNGRAGGPSVVLPVDPELVHQLYAPSQWTVTKEPAEHFRRSVYLVAKRNLRLPFMQVFDQPALQTSCPRRESSTHAPQALEMLNGRTANELAAALADRLAREAGTDPARRVELAYAIVAGRAPTPREKELAVDFVRRQPLAEFALAMFNLNAFLYVD